MANANTWNSLPKTLNDSETIAEYIAAQLATHNADDSAHGQSDEAIYNHRIAEILDHLDQSIINAKIIASHRTYNAVVGTDPEDDFDDIQDAIDFVNGIGGGTIFIKAGTYTQSTDLTLYSNITIEGNDADSVIIDFANYSKSILIKGTSGTHKNNITLRRVTISGYYTITGTACDLEYSDDVTFDECSFISADPTVGHGMLAIYAMYCTRLKINNCYFKDLRYGILPGDTTDLFITDNYIDNVVWQFVEMQDPATRITITGNFAQNVGDFFHSEYGADHILIDGNYISVNSYHAIYIIEASKSIITNNHIYGSDQDYDGIYLEALNRDIVTNNYVYNFNKSGIYLSNNSPGVDRSIISNNVCDSNDRYGIEIAGTNCQYNIVIGNNLSNNTLGGLSDSGTGTSTNNNVTS